MNTLLVFLDTETTGLSPRTHEVIQVGAILAREDHKNNTNPLSIVSILEYQIELTRRDLADPRALAINGYTEERWKNALTKRDAFSRLATRFAGARMVAHNAPFDSQFLAKEFALMNIQTSFHLNPIDTLRLARSVLPQSQHSGGYSLVSLARHFGIPYSNAHTALADAYATFSLYEHLKLHKQKHSKLNGNVQS